MKKISLFLLALFCLVLTGCGGETKEVKSLNDFESVCTDNGYTVNDNYSEYTGISYITGSRKAVVDNLELDMVIYDTEANAKKAQDSHIKAFKNIKSSGATGESKKGKNFYSFSLISNGYYMVSSRIDNTLIFTKTDVQNKDKIINILDNLNY